MVSYRPSRRWLPWLSKLKDIALEHQPKVLMLVNTQLLHVLSFQSYRLIDVDQRYNDVFEKQPTKTDKLMKVQRRLNKFGPADLIAVQNFLSKYKKTCSSN